VKARFAGFVADVPDGWRDQSVISFACPSDVVVDPRAMRPASNRPTATVAITWADRPARATATTVLDEQLANGAALFAEYEVRARAVDGELATADVSFVQGERILQLVAVRIFGERVVVVTGSAFAATWDAMRPKLLDVARSVAPA
jgi:hypothetical protein